MTERVVLDANVLISAVNSGDAKHLDSYGFIKDRQCTTWVVPTIAYFEFQAAQSRLRREGKRALRELYLPNAEVFEITAATLRRASEEGLFESLSQLRGADLVYACVAALEHLPLATHDSHFRSVETRISVLWV